MAVVIIVSMLCLCLGQSPVSDDEMDREPAALDDRIPVDAKRVMSQEDIDSLPAGSNAVLAADAGDLVLSRPIALFGNGKRVNSITLAAEGARASGLIAKSVVVRADGCTVDHCIVDSDQQSAIRADRVKDLRVSDNEVRGNRVRNDCGIYITNSTRPVVDRNTVKGAYYCIYIERCTDPLILYNDVRHVDGFRQGNDIYVTYTQGGVFRGNRVEYDPYHGPGSAQDHNAIGFDHVEGILIEDNIAEGHYYTLKIYNSHDCIIQNNTLLKGGTVLRTGFYDSDLLVRNNRISGDTGVGCSIGIKIHDGTVDSLYVDNEIWDCEYGIEEFHYPPGTKYLEGGPSLPCSNITLRRNYIHDCSGRPIIILDKGSCILEDNYYTPTPAPEVTPGPKATPRPAATSAPASQPSQAPSPTPQTSSGNPIIDFFSWLCYLLFG